MKILIRLSLVVFAVAFLDRGNAAPYTNYLDQASNAIYSAYATLTNTPPPLDRDQQRVRMALTRALRDLRRPSTSVSGDLTIFIQLATHLLPLQEQAEVADVGTAMTNAFQAFIYEAGTEVGALASRVSALSPFHPARRGASNQVVQAQSALENVVTAPNAQVAIIYTRLAFAKIAAATRILKTAEAHPGFAPNSVIGLTLRHREARETGSVHFDDAMTATDTNDKPGDTPRVVGYTYTRSGMNTAILVLTDDNEGSSTTTVKLTFKSATGGTFTFRDESDEGVQTGSGAFTIE